LLIPDYITAGSLDADVLYQHVQLDIDLMQAVAELEANRSGANLLLNRMYTGGGKNLVSVLITRSYLITKYK
jgi:hypothetical protein